MEDFNSINDKKISFNKMNTLITNEKTSTKINTISSFSSSKFKNKKKIKKRLFSSQQLNKEKDNGIIIFRDYLYDLITYQKKIIKNLKNLNAEEIRSNNQIKSFIADCINDINIELFDLKENNINDDKEREEQIKYNENLLYILSFIFDNCFSGIKQNIKKLINKSRNNNINNGENRNKYMKYLK